MDNKFTIQTPDFYKAIYKNKSYQLETIQLLNYLSSIMEPPWDILDVGSGTGQLINFLYPFSNKYIAIEPSKLMYQSLVDFLKEKRLSEISAINSTFQEYLGNYKDSDFNILIANFNVFNYLKYDELISYFKLIYKNNKNKKIIAFDTWSLSYVIQRPKSMRSKYNFEIKKGGTKYKIERESNSFFDKSKSELNIDFSFSQVQPEKIFLGQENHLIYPFDIDVLRRDIEEFSTNFFAVPFPFKLVKKNSFDHYRNWLIVITLEK